MARPPSRVRLVDIVHILFEALLLFAPGTLLGLGFGCLMRKPLAAFLVGFVLTALTPATAVWSLAKARPEMAAESPLANVAAPAALALLSGLLVGGGAAAVVRRKGK